MLIIYGLYQPPSPDGFRQIQPEISPDIDILDCGQLIAQRSKLARSWRQWMAPKCKFVLYIKGYRLVGSNDKTSMPWEPLFTLGDSDTVYCYEILENCGFDFPFGIVFSIKEWGPVSNQ